MGIRRIKSAGYTLPPNPVFVELTRSDGDSSTWPTETEPKVKGGEVNFYRPCGLDEAITNRWRMELGVHVAEKMGLPGGLYH